MVLFLLFSTILKERCKFPNRSLRLIMTCLQPISLTLSKKILVDTHRCAHKFLQLSEYHTLNYPFGPINCILDTPRYNVLLCKLYLRGSIWQSSQTCLYLNFRLSITGTIILTKLNSRSIIWEKLESTPVLPFSPYPFNNTPLFLN